MHKKFSAIAFTAIIASASITGGLIYTTYTSNQTAELRIFTAASLTHVIANMTKQFEQANNCKLLINSGSSGALYTQIAEGSPCDIYMSADNRWTNQLKTDGFLYQNTAINFASNSLEVILAPGNPAGITSLADLAKPGIKLVIAEPAVPAGNYANQTLWKIDSTWGNPSSPQYDASGAYVNYNASVYSNVRSYESNVENVVGQVSLSGTTGLYDAGIVYTSDGIYSNLTDQQIKFLKIPPEVNQKAMYGIAIIELTSQPELAQKFMNFWTSDQGKSLLIHYGFCI
ncbi:MAG: molybdate ABC transporter substrate-binding protein [Nitrososphaerota archaeon]|jgi:molybdate transport system substrate-binding protein|nr:molybdate ABC transporter substrate-binding protein [Nitrososphaerota archaeon]